MKRIIALFLSALMILSTLAFVGCGDNAETDTSAESASETEKTAEVDEDGLYVDPIPEGKYDYGGRDFIITVPWPDYLGSSNYDQTELTSDTVYDEVYYRNRKVEAKYNVKISVFECGITDTYVEDIQPYIISDAGAFDLICFAYSTSSVGLISAGLLTTWNDVPLIDYDMPWWNKNAIEVGTINGNIYFNIGAFNWYTMATACGMFFNERLRSEYQLEDFYSVVDNGEWTLDKLQEYCRAVAKDLDSNGKYNKKDQYGLVCTAVCGDIISWGCGFETVTNNGDGTFTINLGNERHQQILNKVCDIFKKANGLTYSLGGTDLFTNGQSLFVLDMLRITTDLREMDDDYGILPLPKLNTAQENYINYSDAWGLANALPITTDPADFEMFGAILTSLCVESKNKIYPAYYEYTLKGRDTRDTDSWRMLDIINDTLVFDFGLFFQDGGSQDAWLLCFQKLLKYGKESTDLASYRAEHIDELTAHYEEVMKFGLDDAE